LPPISPDLLAELQALEKKAVDQAEKGNSLEEALETLNQVILMCPTYASGYNNRAQVYRLLKRDKDAEQDLGQAIEYATTRELLGKAYTQRAILRQSLGDLTGAEKDFQSGAQCGNEVAKQKISSNPFAKLCNAMVTEVMKKEMSK
jgi:tetratricopeptide (TPR) repeat protein